MLAPCCGHRSPFRYTLGIFISSSSFRPTPLKTPTQLTNECRRVYMVIDMSDSSLDVIASQNPHDARRKDEADATTSASAIPKQTKNLTFATPSKNLPILAVIWKRDKGRLREGYAAPAQSVKARAAGTAFGASARIRPDPGAGEGENTRLLQPRSTQRSRRRIRLLLSLPN